MKRLATPLILLAACTAGPGAATTTSPTSTAPTTTVTTAPTTTTTTIPVPEGAWAILGPEGLIRSDDGPTRTGGPAGWETLARDHSGGLAFVSTGSLWWLPPNESEPRRVGAADGDLLEVVPTASGPVARIALGGCEIVWLRLDDGSQVEAPDRSPARRGCLDGYDEWTAVNGLSALIEGPGATFDSEGQVTGVEDVAALQITRDGEVVAEIPIGGFYEAYARIHDFDGRFVIVSRGPFEPAMPAESYFVIDLETGEVRYPGVHEGASGSLLGPDVDAVPALPEVPYVHRGTPMFSDDRISHLEDGTYVGYVTYAAHEGLTGRPEIHFDLAVWLVGKEADYAALEDGEESPRPNDYYIRNEDSLELVLPVAPDVGVTSVWFHYDQSNSIESRPITWQQFVDAMTGEPSGSETAMVHDPWWVTLVDGQVVAIDEQYIP